MNFYIYVRENEWCTQHNIVKIGITTKLQQRENTYMTSEILMGTYHTVYLINVTKKIQMNFVDNFIKSHLNSFNVKYNAGTEFYKKM